MPYKGRSLYNLLKMNLSRNPNLEVEPWQVEDYRSLSKDELFNRLETHQIQLDEKHFLLYINECDSPEDLTDCIYLDQDYVKHEEIYLCVFELWRRLVPYKQSLSLFCDALDHAIELYEEGDIECEEDLQANLLSLQRILDDNVDEGGDALEGFKLLSDYSCHDLEVFVYEYIAHQLDVENELYASELLHGFYEYMTNKKWFDFLRIRTVSATSIEEANIMLERLLESLEASDIQLLFEVLHFLIYVGETELFQAAFNQAIDSLGTEEDLRELLRIASDYFNCIDKDKEEQTIQEILDQRKNINPQEAIDPADYSLQILKDLITFSPA